MRGSELIDVPRTAAGRLPSAEALALRLETHVVAAIDGALPSSTSMGRGLDRLLTLPWHTLVAFSIFASALLRAVEAETARGYPQAWLAVAAIPVALFLLRRPLALGIVMALAGVYLRALYLSSPETCDQLAVSRAAFGVAMGGGNPYGIGYAASSPPGSPFPYAPLAMPVAMLGVPLEVIAIGGTMLILAFSRSLITLALTSAWVLSIEFGICGLNDQVPGFLLLVGLLLIERRAWIPGAALVAISAAIKPYTLAWFPPLIGFGGLSMGVLLVGVSIVAWLPVLAWGPSSFLRSIELARATHPFPDNTLNMPALRILVVPLAIVSLLVRSWTVMVLMGSLIFLTMLFLDYWASLGYWMVVGPLVGLIGDRALRRFGIVLRRARVSDTMTAATVPG